MDGDGIIVRIKELQRSLNLNNKQFSELIDVSKYNLSKYYNGSLNITKATINAIVANTGANKEWLLTGKGEMRVKSPRAYPEPGTVSTAAEPALSYGYREKYYEVLEENRELNLEIKELRKKLEQQANDVEGLRKGLRSD